MKTPNPDRPCPWCGGDQFIVVESVFLEITDYGRRFDAITCTACGHTSFFALTPRTDLTGKIVRVAQQAPYR
jgi:hypothetical protein